MNLQKIPLSHNIIAMVAALSFVALSASPVVADGYGNALNGVKQIKAVFEVSQGSPQVSNIVFWAIRNVYEDESAKSLPMAPDIAIVFHGPAVKLLSSDRSTFKQEDFAEIDRFQEALRQMKKDGVKLEVCDYALKVMKVEPATVLPEIDHVGNGFISVIGYQSQGYAVVRVP